MNYIIVYLEIEHLLNFLSQAEKGDFLDLLIQYGKKQELPRIENSKLLNVFNFMKGRLDAQFEKARIKAETARKNGVNGGRPSKPINNPPKPKKTKSVSNFIEPTLQEIQEYCRERKNVVNAKAFYDYYSAGNWKDSKGNQVKNWKQKLLTWENKGDTPSQRGAQSNTNESLTLFINNLIGHTLIESIGVSASNKAVLQFTNKSCFDSFVKMKDELRNEIKDKITKELSTKGFEPKY